MQLQLTLNVISWFAPVNSGTCRHVRSFGRGLPRITHRIENPVSAFEKSQTGRRVIVATLPYGYLAMRVLVVEDDPMIGEAVVAGRAAEGYAGDWVHEGHPAAV